MWIPPYGPHHRVRITPCESLWHCGARSRWWKSSIRITGAVSCEHLRSASRLTRDGGDGWSSIFIDCKPIDRLQRLRKLQARESGDRLDQAHTRRWHTPEGNLHWSLSTCRYSNWTDSEATYFCRGHCYRCRSCADTTGQTLFTTRWLHWWLDDALDGSVVRVDGRSDGSKVNANRFPIDDLMDSLEAISAAD